MLRGGGGGVAKVCSILFHHNDPYDGLDRWMMMIKWLMLAQWVYNFWSNSFAVIIIKPPPPFPPQLPRHFCLPFWIKFHFQTIASGSLFRWSCKSFARQSGWEIKLLGNRKQDGSFWAKGHRPSVNGTNVINMNLRRYLFWLSTRDKRKSNIL